MPDNTQKITPEFAEGKILLFAPSTEEEAFDLIKDLLRKGYLHGYTTAPTDSNIRKGCLDYMEKQTSFALRDGKVTVLRNLDPENTYIRDGYGCKMSDMLEAAPYAESEAAKEAKNNGDVDEAALAAALKELDELTGLEQTKKDVRQTVALARINRVKKEMGMPVKPVTLHMVFNGNPGTGKTTVARIVPKIYHALGFLERAEIVEVKREDLVAGYIGQTAIKTKKKIDEAIGGVLFIDEAYSLTQAHGHTNVYGQEAVDTLVAEMENNRDNLVVIVAGYPEEMKTFIQANPGLASRFNNVIAFDDYDEEALGQIMDGMVAEHGSRLTPDARAAALARLDEEKKSYGKKGFGNARAVRNIVEKALRLQAERIVAADLPTKHANGKLSERAFKKALGEITAADVEAISRDNITLTQEKKNPIGFGYPRPKLTSVK